MRPELAAALAVVLLLAGCTDPDSASSPSAPSSDPSGSSSASATATPDGGAESPSAGASSTPSPLPSATPTPRARPPHPVSLPALFDKEYDGRRLRLGDVVATTDAYEQRTATFRGDGLTISGQMLVPHGRGPFPVLVLAHGYIDPAVYVTGQGLRREQDWLARAGYAVLHVDYRNHAGSDRDARAFRDDPGRGDV